MKKTAKKKPDSWFVQKLIEMGACKKATRYAKTKRTFSAAWRNCTNPHWRRWLLTQLKFAQHDYTVGSVGCPLCRISEAELNQRFPADRVAKALRKWKAPLAASIARRALNTNSMNTRFHPRY